MYKMEDFSNLGVWHNLLLYYLINKNDIIKRRVSWILFNDKDYEEIMAWSEEKVKKSLDVIGTSSSDRDNCPWCIHHNIPHNQQCENGGCGYGKRHDVCFRKKLISNEYRKSTYRNVLDAFRAKGITNSCTTGGICTYWEIAELSRQIRHTYLTLPHILWWIK